MRRAQATSVSAVLVAAATAFAALPAQAAEGSLPQVHAKVETPAVFDDEEGGNASADDPAIWRNDADPNRSLVIATAKEGGIRVYDLDAREVQSIPAQPAPGHDDAPGRINNVDIVGNYAVVSDRGFDALRIYSIDANRAGAPLEEVTDPANAPLIFSADQAEVNDETTAYGLAAWQDPESGRIFAAASEAGRTTHALLELKPDAEGKVGYTKVRTLDLPAEFTLPNGATWSPCEEPGELPQSEGMVADPVAGVLYIGQEDVGFWRVNADFTGEPELVDAVRDFGAPATWDPATEECTYGEDPGFGGDVLTADVEGLTLWNEPKGQGYLLVSSQGDNTFAVYGRSDNKYRGGFALAPGSVIDGSEDCDGAAVLNAPLGERYPNGLAVIHDGYDDPQVEGREGSNYKFVDLAELKAAVGLR
ncbi:phytase [Saccharopolyspora sp. WRP15-2]|uniref:Phytase n=1 Tax=Saccharopolyspora oryzae TaxID=2997343 RepID=A0ABT4UZG8_9PSEU|nr:phytase [Saccharopolyspora oryzae]MDA3627113.1 phytase [Saccharopolyspora oryzae]